MNRLIKDIEDRLFSAKDTVCLDRARLVTKGFAKFANQPMPIRRAKTFDYLLENMQLDLLSNPILAGNTSTAPRAWMVFPEFEAKNDTQIEIEHSDLKGFLDGKIPDDILDFWKGKQFGSSGGIGHMSLDYERIVKYGLNDVLKRLESHSNNGTPENRIYRQAMKICCRAVIKWSKRYAEQAELAAGNCHDKKIAGYLLRIADSCRQVPAKPARNLFDGLQAISLVHLATALEGQGLSMSIGSPDRALAAFSDEVDQDPETAIALCRAFLLKIAASSFMGRGSKTQAITIGGATEQGDSCNPVTNAFLEAFNRTPVNDPHLFLRWHNRINTESWNKGLEMLANGRSMPMLINDHQVVPGLIEAGVSPLDAWDYCIVGCNELGIPGRNCQSGFCLGMGFNDLQILDDVIREIADKISSLSQILERYEKRIMEITAVGLSARKKQIADWMTFRPFPFCSACSRNCPESGLDALVGMPYNNIYGVFIRGTSNATNVLAVIDHLVFGTKKYTIPELLKGIDKEDKKILAAIADTPKWGNDDDQADRVGVMLNQRRDRALREAAEQAGVPPFALCHVVRSLHHVDGKRIGATLDGRRAGSPVSDSLGAVLGTQSKGPTALLNSVLKLDAKQWFTGIYNLNITLPVGEQARIEVIRPLVEAFFADGGQELQINVLDTGKLKRARKNPEKYRDLVVRVAGLNARFVELSAIEQEEIISRAENVSPK